MHNRLLQYFTSYAFSSRIARRDHWNRRERLTMNSNYQGNNQNNYQGGYQGNRFVKPFEYGYFSLAAHIVLLLITFGIWWFIWVYRTTDYLNRLETEPSQTPVCQMLLCLIPFYSIYWTYKNADRIDKYAFQNNTNSDITLLSVILAIFVQIVAAIIMQDKLNEIVQPRMTNNYQYQSEGAGSYTYANAGGAKSSSR